MCSTQALREVTGSTQQGLTLKEEHLRSAAVGGMAGATPLLYRRVELRWGGIKSGAGMALKAQLVWCYRVNSCILAPVGFMAATTVTLYHRLMHIAVQLSRVELLMTGIAHLRHRL